MSNHMEGPANDQEREVSPMRRIAALIQVIVIILLVGFSTWQLFLGNFEAAFATLPLLIVYYVFVTAKQRRK